MLGRALLASIVLLGVAGADARAAPPVVTITRPDPGAVLRPGFAIFATVTDPDANDVITRVEALVDGTEFGELVTVPYSFLTPTTLASGPHVISVRAFDLAGEMGTASITITVAAACTADTQCTGDDVCADAYCEPGPCVAGGIGRACARPEDCFNGTCALYEGVALCTRSCESMICPTGFTCVGSASASGCWPIAACVSAGEAVCACTAIDAGVDASADASTDASDPVAGDGDGCGCATGAPAAKGWPLLAMLAILRRRRRA